MPLEWKQYSWCNKDKLYCLICRTILVSITSGSAFYVKSLFMLSAEKLQRIIKSYKYWSRKYFCVNDSRDSLVCTSSTMTLVLNSSRLKKFQRAMTNKYLALGLWIMLVICYVGCRTFPCVSFLECVCCPVFLSFICVE